jgi:hypothetical protein
LPIRRARGLRRLVESRRTRRRPHLARVLSVSALECAKRTVAAHAVRRCRCRRVLRFSRWADRVINAHCVLARKRLERVCGTGRANTIRRQRHVCRLFKSCGTRRRRLAVYLTRQVLVISG